ncbi:MAG: hypothetical protein VKJ46_01955, partial [Leptolyngbyaceae bacterium]|nr:hypothetical protein [Leptolyngbyaceae bacterium]
MTEKIIYDFGSSNGDDIPYYLLKAEKVVAVEANPSLAREIEKRFSSEVSQGKLMIENCVLTVNHSLKTVPFYIHKTSHVLSQFPKPLQHSQEYNEVLLPAKNVVEIIKKHGNPYYIKI